MRIGPNSSSFLTTEKPRPYPKYEGDGARWRYFGHACILLETRGHEHFARSGSQLHLRQ